MVNPEALARLFHETYERLAPRFGYTTRAESAVPWEQVPPQQRALMVQTAQEVAAELQTEFVYGLEPDRELPDDWSPVGALVAVRCIDCDGQRRTTTRYAGDVMAWEAAGMLRAATRDVDCHLDAATEEGP